MRQVEKRRPRWLRSIVAAVAVAAGTLTATAAPAQGAGAADLITDNVVEINETVSDAGFVHPGVGLSADDLRNAQEMVRTGQEPWASYFDAMAATGHASKTFRASNSKSASEPDVALDPNYNHGSLRGRQTRDSFGALTQSLMWTMTGDEVYRKNAIQVLRTWASMNPDGYKYFPDAHIHTGHPLYQHLMAAEIIRATEPLDDDSPGEYDGYDVVWSETDDANLLGNYANPIVDVFNFSNERWMNQHNFGLFGRIATAIYADDTEGYATGVEWYTVNTSFDDYINGAMVPQMPLIEADDPDNPYGEDFVQVREMGRDNAHSEANVDNFAGLARMLEVQSTKVDPVDGTVSSADNAVSAYDFFDRRLLDGAEQLYKFMMGGQVPWIDERGWNGTISQAYRGRMYNMISVAELYYEYSIERGVDLEAEAPHLSLLASRMDGPIFYRGTGVSNFWAQGDKNPEYWVAFPEELAGNAPPAQPENPTLHFDDNSLLLDDGTEYVTEDDETFARASLSETGTTSAMPRMERGQDTVIGLKYRSNGPADLEVLANEEPTGLNPNEEPAHTIAERELPDTGGEWRYIAYPAGGNTLNFFRLTGADGITVDLHSVILSGQTDLTAPEFKQADNPFYLTAGTETKLDLAADDTGGNVSYTAQGLPEGASFDAGTLSWTPTEADAGRHEVQVVADDGETVAARTFELVVAEDRAEMIDKLLDDTVDPDAVYTAATYEPFQAALADAEALTDTGTDAEFREAFTALQETIAALSLLNPQLDDGSLDYPELVTATVLNEGAVAAMADGSKYNKNGDVRAGSFYLDFGPGYRVAAEEIGLQANFAFPMRSQGTNVYGSNDGITWDLLSSRETSDTNDFETIPVVDEHQGEQYRYFKLQLDNPGPPIDPAYPGIWSIGEFHVFGERSEVPGTISDVTMASADAVDGRVTNGDTVTVNLVSPTPVSDVAVTIGGQDAEVSSPDQGTTWAATAELADVSGGGMVPITVDHTTADGTSAETILGTTDGKQLYASDESNLVDLADAEVIKADGSPDPAKATQAATMLDGKASTFSNIATADGQADLIWDFGQGAQVTADRLDYLARQHDEGMRQMDDLVFEGSNDLSSWTTLTEPTFKTLSWQNLEASGDEGFRYLRVKNGMLIHIAELRLFGSTSHDLHEVLARADAVDLTAYSRSSAIGFTREVEAVRTAAAEEGADEPALAVRLLDAWDLLEAPPVNAAAIDQSWVEASSASWDGKRDAAGNGWAMFDGDEATFTDTKEAAGWVQVLPTEETAFAIETVRYLPRSTHVGRANGIQFQGSNDGGATWETFATISGASGSWSSIDLDAAVEYGALRVNAPAGNTNLAEVQFLGATVDTTGLDLYLSETEQLTEADWTAATWADLTEAREAGAALRADGAAPTQAEVDAAAEAIAAAVAALEAA